MNGALKWIMYWTVLNCLSVVTGGLTFSSPWVPAGVAAFWAVVGHLADQWIVPRWGNLLATLAGASFMAVTLWTIPWWVAGTEVRWWAVLLTVLILGTVELVMHRYILRYRVY
ncbi:hypothetical protein GCM10011571_00530 [Marinithermofilum abyssi]|uniref:Uncharacterized protein n=1 Tax=Marinithermofilum abyssi TaxID=1571185 RepID=A0A8J2VGS9_9BACL|nr:DUF2512 family protein [Marinithermofilum abyssi]GGE03566.1 hypothetical protein GCM10011571_00530 [Marinithermofilum abyssi]